MTDQETEEYKRQREYFERRLKSLEKALRRKFKHKANWNPLKQSYDLISLIKSPPRTKKLDNYPWYGNEHNKGKKVRPESVRYLRPKPHEPVRNRQVTGGNL